MYFSNIHNPELQHFHGTVGVDFTISLTNILESNLFEIEDLGNNIYRVFPLFYCEKIISSNSEDKILDNRCLILIKQDNETYISFMTNKDKSNIIINDNLIPSKRKGNSLSREEFNAMVYLMRSKSTLNGQIDFEDSSIFDGVYATYELNDGDDVARNNTGFIVTPEIKRNPLTIRLLNPFFLNAKYRLTCTVKSLTGANVCDNDNADFKTVDTFTVLLVEDMEVALDVNNYNDDSVLLFTFDVMISFDVPEINSNFRLNLTSSSNRISLGEPIRLSATLSGEDNLEGYVVDFYEDDILLGQRPTDENGVAELDYTPTYSSTHNYSCNCLGISSNVNIIVYNKNTYFLFEISSSSIRVDNTITLTGTLLDYDDNPLPNMSVKLYENNILIDDDLTTDNNGSFTKIITHNIVNNFDYQAEYLGSDGYVPATSEIISLEVYKYPTSISLDTSASTVYYRRNGGCNFVVSGVLNKEGAAFAGQNVKIYNGNTLVDTLRTQSDGSFTKTIYPANTGTYNLKAVYEGTDKIQNINSTVKTVVVRRIKTYLTAIPNKTNITLGESITIAGRLTDEWGNGLANCLIRVSGTEIGGYTNNNGEYSFSYNEASRTLGSKTITASFTGYTSSSFIGDAYDRVYSADITVNCVKFTSQVNILNTQENYTVGDELLIEVTSNDNNFNPSSVDVTFNGTTSNITAKNQAGKFIFVIPEIDSNSNNYAITARYNGDNTHENSSDTENILVYKKVQSLTLANNGSTLIVTVKNIRGEVVPNVTLPILDVLLTGFNKVNFGIENLPFDNVGKAEFPLPPGTHGTGTIQVKYNEIGSNIINVTL